MSNSTKKWYALYTKAGFEKKVANLLSRKNIENYCPLKRQWNGRKKVVLEPLFNSYVFVQINDVEKLTIRQTDCVVNFVYWLGKPAIIRDEEIEIMKHFMNEYANVKLEKVAFCVNGMTRLIARLETDNSKADIISVENNTVKILLQSLGYILVAEALKSNTEILNPSKQSYTVVENYQYLM